jgi:meiotically up-regulated gene 157 (Mug157) protein
MFVSFQCCLRSCLVDDSNHSELDQRPEAPLLLTIRSTDPLYSATRRMIMNNELECQIDSLYIFTGAFQLPTL